MAEEENRKLRRSQAETAKAIIVIIVRTYRDLTREKGRKIMIDLLTPVSDQQEYEFKVACLAFLPSYLALAVEYGLKSLHKKKRRTHNLSDLYRLLEPDIKKEMELRFNQIRKEGGDDWVDLDKKLEAHKDDYRKLRYFEGELGDKKLGFKHWVTMYHIVCATVDVYEKLSAGEDG